MQSIVNTGVFERQGEDQISSKSFYGIMSLVVIWGLALTAVVAHKTMLMHYAPGWGVKIGVGLVIPIIGVFIAISSANAFISFVGYNMVVIPFGIILGPILGHYNSHIISNTCVITAAITLFMGLMGTTFPNIFENLGAPLLLSLGGLVIVRIVQIFVPEMASLGFIDYIAAGIFSLYIGYDMHRASSVAKTVDNAVDAAVDLYLDILNLFINLLKIMGRLQSESDSD